MEKEYLLESWAKRSIQVRTAIEDNIDIEFKLTGWHGSKIERPTFNIPCEKCGKLTNYYGYSRKRNYLCDCCKGKIIANRQICDYSEKITDAESKYENRFAKAVEEIKKQVRDFDKYEKPIRLAKERCEKYGSIPEAMVAIELLKLGYAIIPQQKIRSYKVDFVIKNRKWIIEVDGSTFHNDIEKDKQREIEILSSLGFDWKIIRISAEEVRDNISGLNGMIYNCLI